MGRELATDNEGIEGMSFKDLTARAAEMRTKSVETDLDPRQTETGADVIMASDPEARTT